jgi:hypothetical protein
MLPTCPRTNIQDGIDLVGFAAKLQALAAQQAFPDMVKQVHTIAF